MAMQRFTVYDVLEARGEFKKNPANQGSQDPQGALLYTGPVPYPKMLFHPKGEERITVQGELVNTPIGPKVIGEKRELIYRIVKNEQEEEKAVAEGWHTHPAYAIRASGRDAPSTGDAETIANLKIQIEKLQAEQKRLMDLQAKPMQASPVNPLSKPVANPISPMPGRPAA